MAEVLIKQNLLINLAWEALGWGKAHTAINIKILATMEVLINQKNNKIKMQKVKEIKSPTN